MEKNYYLGFSLKMSMFGTLTQHHSLGLTRSKSDLSMSNKGHTLVFLQSFPPEESQSSQWQWRGKILMESSITLNIFLY